MAGIFLIKFFKYFIDDKKKFFKYFFLSFIVGLLELCGIALIYPFVMRIISENNFSRTSALIGIAIITAFTVKNIFMIFYNSLQADFTKNCEASIRNKFMKYFINGDYETLIKIEFAQKQQILGYLIHESIDNYLVRILNLNVNIFVFAIIIGFLFVKFFWATVITLTSAVFILAIQAAFFKIKAIKNSKLMKTANLALNQATNIPIFGLKSIKVFGAENYFCKRYDESNSKYKNATKRLLFYGSIPPYVTEPLIIILLVILLTAISVQNISNSNILIASYAVIASAIFRLAPTISRIQVNLTGINTAVPLVNELIEIYENMHISDYVYVSSEKINNFNSNIILKDVCYSYNGKPTLKNINLTINKGEHIGIVGPSGAGKTTLADIIAGLLSIKSGELYLDNKFIKSPRMPKLKLGYVPQEYVVIPATIRENVAFGQDNIDDEKVIQALKTAQIYDYIIENYPDGIYASPFVDSSGLSQGQKQRIAIARALYSDPELLIFDEATSALDLKTEDEICDVINRIKGKITVITITHRLSTIKNADKIILMNNLTINDIGTYNELLQNCPDFKEWVALNQSNLIH